LAPIRNAVQLLKKLGPKDPQLEWGRDVIDRQVGHMARLLDDLLDVARIMRGKISLKTAPMQIAEAIEYALEATRPSIEAKQQVLIISLPDKPLWVQGDLTRLAQVVANLLDNAMKYTDPGGRIRLSATEEADCVTLRIQDTGVGIDPELLPHVFDLFTQAHQSLGRSQGGLGIGLTLTQQLVHLHGGTIAASSLGLDQGSEFTVRLPLLRNWCPLTERRMASSQAQPSSSSSKLRILVVDDYADAAQSLALLLRAEGHEVETADCGAAALERAANFEPQAVLLDIGLPDLDGYQVAQRLRKIPEARQAVLIALTGYGQNEDRERARNAGFDHFLLKPPDIDALSAVLATLA
jgi:CheY-like chemotaxis protein